MQTLGTGKILSTNWESKWAWDIGLQRFLNVSVKTLDATDETEPEFLHMERAGVL